MALKLADRGTEGLEDPCLRILYLGMPDKCDFKNVIKPVNTDKSEKCVELKFHRIKFPGRIFLSTSGVELGGSKDLKMRKLTLWLNGAKNTDYIEIYFKQKLWIVKFPKRNLLGAYLYVP